MGCTILWYPIHLCIPIKLLYLLAICFKLNEADNLHKLNTIQANAHKHSVQTARYFYTCILTFDFFLSFYLFFFFSFNISINGSKACSNKISNYDYYYCYMDHRQHMRKCNQVYFVCYLYLLLLAFILFIIKL